MISRFCHVNKIHQRLWILGAFYNFNMLFPTNSSIFLLYLMANSSPLALWEKSSLSTKPENQVLWPKTGYVISKSKIYFVIDNTTIGFGTEMYIILRKITQAEDFLIIENSFHMIIAIIVYIISIFNLS